MRNMKSLRMITNCCEDLSGMTAVLMALVEFNYMKKATAAIITATLQPYGRCGSTALPVSGGDGKF